MTSVTAGSRTKSGSQPQGEQPTSIRFHRACSWMARVEQMPEGQDHDLGLVSLWIAFNSLYGQWDSQKREPRPDRESWRAFVDRILKLDRDGYVPCPPFRSTSGW